MIYNAIEFTSRRSSRVSGTPQIRGCIPRYNITIYIMYTKVMKQYLT